MGFGLLFAGFVLLYFPVPFLDIAGILVGCGMLCVALFRLRGYHHPFGYAAVLSVINVPMGILLCLLRLSGYLTRFAPKLGIASPLNAVFDGVFGRVFNVAYPAWLLVFYLVLLYCLFSIGREVALMKIQVKSLRNLVITAVYFALEILLQANDHIFGSITPYFAAPMYLLNYVWVVLVALNIYSCYRYITAPDAEQRRAEKQTRLGKALDNAEEKRRNEAETDSGDVRKNHMNKRNEKLRKKQQKREGKQNR